MAESKFPWERDALDFLRERFPSHDPYRAWSNFEFIADDGSINEVDSLLFTPQGFFLVEIKSRPGRLFGDAGTWTWEADGRLSTDDNPLIAANLKAKKLRTLLQRQKAFKGKGQPPFVEALIFCSAPELRCELQGNARFRVCLRDRDASGDQPARPGIMAAIMRRECAGLDPRAKGTHDRPMAKLVSQAMDQAGIRPSQRMRKVSDYVLEQLIGEGPGYQDWQARHTQVAESKRRVRLYLVRTEATQEDRDTIQRAALREFQILEALSHPGILRAYNFTEHELGPALLFEHDPFTMRLDHYLAQQKDKLGVETQLDLMRQIAEVIRYAHDKKVVHRGLCPQSILVTCHSSFVIGHSSVVSCQSSVASGQWGERPRIKVFNWQVGYRQGTTSSGVSRAVSATSHVDRLVEDAATAYMAPEALTESGTGEHLDVFSLGAIAYHIFSGAAPAANAVELSERLRETKGLQISSVLNGASEWLQELVRYATNPVVPDRMGSVVDFLGILDEVENELTSPEPDTIDDPSRAQIGDRLPGGYTVVRRIGQGACSVALLVERDGQDYILKAANDPEHNARLKDEAELLGKEQMRHSCIVDVTETMEIGQYFGFLMRPVFVDREKRLIETLGHRLRKEGRLHIDLLQRFGEDLLGVVNHLEEQGIPHRDIKPDNIAVGMVGGGKKLHLVLFDFSLSRTPADNIRAGTTGYLDPLLPLRKPPRWDLHAERYAAAVTLYELATGTLPKWGDGTTDPSHLSPDTEITIDAELFDPPALRESLTEFFTQALRRNIVERFDNAEEMLRAWRNVFAGIEPPGAISDHEGEGLAEVWDQATFETPIVDLHLGSRAANALDRANIATVADLLRASPAGLWRLRGVGKKTCRELLHCQRILRERLGTPTGTLEPVESTILPETPADADVATWGIDLLMRRVFPYGPRLTGEQETLAALLSLDLEWNKFWPSQTDVARHHSLNPAAVHGVLKSAIGRWQREPALTAFRHDLVELVRGEGGVCVVDELPAAAVAARGSGQDEPLRSRQASAVVRAAVEVERVAAEPRLFVRRVHDKVFVATDQAAIDLALKLGRQADTLAQQDPLVPPPRVMEQLQALAAAAPELALKERRLLRLAAAASLGAALSGKNELYPRGMEAQRALKLSLSGLYGVRELTVEQIQERVGSRYPAAEGVPNRPALDELLRAVGFDFPWSPEAAGGRGAYTCIPDNSIAVTTGSQSISRHSTSITPRVGEITPEEADARQFEERLQRSIKEGAFLALLVNPKYYDRARSELCHRFPLQLVDFEGLFLDALRETADKARVNWNLVLQTDIRPHEGDWDRLMMLVGRTMTVVEKKLLGADKTMLVIYAGLLARYDQMGLLSQLSQKVGRTGGIPGLWLLLPGDNQASIDGQPVPLIGPGQRARIPESWLQNVHRARGNGETHP